MKNSGISIKKRRVFMKKGWVFIICLWLAGSVWTSCQTPVPKQPDQKTDSLAGQSGSGAAVPVSSHSSGTPDTTSLKGDWFLEDVKGSPLTSLKTAFIRFDTAKSSFTGNTGCNTMKGIFWYSDNDTSLVFGDRFLTTKMACNGIDEHAFIKSLMSTNHYLLRNSRLVLLSEDGKELSSWKRAPGTQRTVRL